MIIGSALGRLFNGLTVDLTIDGNLITRDVQYGYGDQKELIKWVLNKNNGNQQKYPLIWYVVAPSTTPNSFKRVRSSIIILQNTRVDWFNETRSVKSYDDIIEPTWQKVKRVIELNPYISVLGDIPTKYRIKDEPNFGLNASSETDFSSTATQSDKGVTIDVVDGRVINLEFNIKTNCI